MKTRIALTVLIVLLLASCEPVTPMPEIVPTPLPAPTAIVPAAWPDLHDGWMTFKSPTKFYLSVYDPQGYIWALGSNDSYWRWDIETNEAREHNFYTGSGFSHMILFDGIVWAVTFEGQVFQILNEEWYQGQLPGGTKGRYYFYATGNRLWVVGDTRLYYLDGTSWQYFDTSSEPINGRYVYRIAETKDGSVWFSTDTDVARYDGNTWSSYKNLEYVQNMLTTSDGLLWFVFYNTAVSFDGTNWTPLVLPGDHFQYSILKSFLLSDGSLFLATDKGTFTINNQIVTQVAVPELPQASIRDLIDFTSQGSIFLPYQGQEIYLHDGEKLRTFHANSDVESGVSPLVGSNVIGFAPDGALWTQTNDGVVRFDGKLLETLPFYIPPKNRIDLNGSLWGLYPEDGKLYLYKTGQKQPSIFDLHMPINDFAFAPDDTLWLALQDGFIANFSPDDPKNKDFINLDRIKIGEGLVNYALHPSRIEVGPDGTVYVFIDQVGIYGYDGKAWKNYGFSQLRDQSAWAIGSNNQLWVVTPYHLYNYDGEQWVDHPHTCAWPSDLVVAPDDAVWFIDGCDGVYRFDGKELTHFSRNSKLGRIYVSKILVAPDGAIWFFSPQNWARYRP
jgi:streptogramin lyase